MALARPLAAATMLVALSTIAARADVVAHFQCADGSTFDASFSPPGDTLGEVTLAYPDGHKLTLPQVLSADGGRYEKDGTEFWIKGNGGTLTLGGKATTCEAQS